MSPFKPTKIEWITFLTTMPVTSVLLLYLLYGQRFNSDSIFMPGFSLIFLVGFVSWYVHILAMHFLRLAIPEYRQTVTRLLLLCAIYLLLTTASMFLVFYGFNYWHFLGYRLNVQKLNLAALWGVALTLVSVSVWEGEYIFHEWKQSLGEKELLEQLRLQNEFESLKTQVNPHFLFNCFNSLSSLISEDPKQAEKFLDDLSKVYRYLLRSNEDGLTTLKSELQFMRSYFKLLQSRYGDAIEIKIEVDKKYDSYLLPSLSIQIVVENAVKHNVVSKENPLVIDIFTTTGNKLIVNNNLQPKLVKAPSNRIGLANIQSKYQLLEQAGFQVVEDDKNFTVVLPLLWKKAIERLSVHEPAKKELT